MFNNQILIASMPQDIGFYHLKKFYDDDDVDGSKFKMKWDLFHRIDQQGFFYQRHGSNIFQIVTEEFIYFYQFEENSKSWSSTNHYSIKQMSTMFNFIKCTGFMTGNKQKRCIAFKAGQPNITVFMRKFTHSFMKCIDP